MKKLYTLTMLAIIALCSCNGPSKENSSPDKVSIPAPEIEKVVLYEIYVRNFTPEGTFQAIIPQLDKLKELGVNTLWLMPIHPVGVENRKGTFGSPYAVQDFYDVNPEFGTKADFKALVNACHEKGLHILIDLVANHTAWDNKWITEHPDWYTKNEAGEIIPPVDDWSDVADLNYENAAVPAEMAKVMEYWVKEFDIDGYRCDVAYMVPNNFWKNSIANIRKIKPIIMLAEAAGTEFHEIGFDFTYGWEVYHHMKKLFAGASAVSLPALATTETAKVPAGNKILRFTTNHDETSWDDVPVNLFKTREGSLAAFVASTYLPSIPLLYNGQEVGHPQKMNLFEKSNIDWLSNGFMRDAYKQLLTVRNQEAAVLGDEITFFETANPDIIAYQRGSGDAAIFVIVNIRKDLVNFQLPEVLQGKTMLDLLSGRGMNLYQNLNVLGFNYYILKAAQLS
ncbi:MAG: alpha-amylase family glycosyl hydrolase [Sphingobacteriaceae bacterium]|nr:alpha-amylase family glycosyl hydrolase [Sphingobacteriaceae bacterium]